MSEPEALATFHERADNRRRERVVPIVTFLSRFWLAWVLLQISGAASRLARKVVPTS